MHITLQIQTDPSGYVSFVRVPDVVWDARYAASSSGDLRACLAREITQWSFPSADGPSAFATELSFGEYGSSPGFKTLPY